VKDNIEGEVVIEFTVSAIRAGQGRGDQVLIEPGLQPLVDGRGLAAELRRRAITRAGAAQFQASLTGQGKRNGTRRYRAEHSPALLSPHLPPGDISMTPLIRRHAAQLAILAVAGLAAPTAVIAQQDAQRLRRG
jgi:hypothetical protein